MASENSRQSAPQVFRVTNDTAMWPTPFLQTLLEWVLRWDQGTPGGDRPLSDGLEFKMCRSPRRRYCHGSASTHSPRVKVWLHRRFRPFGGWPFLYVDHRLPELTWLMEQCPLRSRIEVLIFVLAHEVRHKTCAKTAGLHPTRRSDSNLFVEMETHCDVAGLAAVTRYRENRAAFWREVRAALRAERARRRAARIAASNERMMATTSQGSLLEWRRRAGQRVV